MSEDIVKGICQKVFYRSSIEDLDEAKDLLKSYKSLPGFVFGAIEEKGKQLIIRSYWEVEGQPVKNQRIAHFINQKP